MPYKSDKIKIEFTKHDRRIKLNEEDKNEIREKYFNQKMSFRGLGREYNVDKKTIKYICFPDYYDGMKESARNRESITTKEKRREYMRNHRRYKHKLYKEGEIK